MKTPHILITLLLLLPHNAAAMDIFVSIAPQKWLVDSLGGDLVTAHTLVAEGRDPHTFEPTPRQMSNLSKAQLYFTVDMEFEHQLVMRIKDSLPGLKFVNSARQVNKIPITGHDDHGHSNESLDPHIWLSPRNLKIMAREMAKAMIEVDSENSHHYNTNLSLFTAQLDTLDERIQRQLRPFSGKTFYVFHPSFGYFAYDYNLHQQPVEIEGKSPSPKQLARLIAQAKHDNVKIIFVQPQYDRKSAEAIARAISGEVVPLDPLAEDVADNLETMMKKIIDALDG